MNELGTLATIATSAVVVLGALYGSWRKWAKPLWKRIVTFVDRLDETLNGRPPRHDAWGRQIAAGSPSLAERMASLEEAVRDRAQLEKRLTAVETIVGEHGQRLQVLESGHQVERIAGKLESAQAWRAVEAIANQPGVVDDDPDTEI